MKGVGSRRRKRRIECYSSTQCKGTMATRIIIVLEKNDGQGGGIELVPRDVRGTLLVSHILQQCIVTLYFYSVTLRHTFHLCFRCRYPSTFSPAHLARTSCLLFCPCLSYIFRTVCAHFSCCSSKYTTFPHAPYRKQFQSQLQLTITHECKKSHQLDSN